MKVFLAIFTEALEGFGFDFLLTLFEEFPVKGNLTANVLGIFFIGRRTANILIFYLTARTEFHRYFIGHLTVKCLVFNLRACQSGICGVARGPKFSPGVFILRRQ